MCTAKIEQYQLTFQWCYSFIYKFSGSSRSKKKQVEETKFIAQVLTLVIHHLANRNGSLRLWVNYISLLFRVLIWLCRPENEILKFMTFQVFHDLYEPCLKVTTKNVGCFLRLLNMTLAITSSSKQTLSTQYSSVTKATSWC